MKVFAAAKITPKPDTLEQDVKATLHKVAEDEVDAALVYQTDVIASPEEVDGIRSRSPRGRQRVSDRHTEGVQGRGDRTGVRRLCALPGGPGGVDEGRVRQAVGS